MDMSELNRHLDDRPDAKVFRMHGDTFTDAELLDLEFQFIFEKTWGFLTLESAMGINPSGSLGGNTPICSAVELRAYWREWRRLMQAGLSGKNSY